MTASEPIPISTLSTALLTTTSCTNGRAGFNEEQRCAIVKQLLNQKARINSCNSKGESALHCAAGNGYSTIVRLLVRAKAYLKGRDDTSATAVIRASQSNHVDALEVLTRAKADVNTSCYNGTR